MNLGNSIQIEENSNSSNSYTIIMGINPLKNISLDLYLSLKHEVRNVMYDLFKDLFHTRMNGFEID